MLQTVISPPASVRPFCLCGDDCAHCPWCKALAGVGPVKDPCADCGGPLWRYLEPGEDPILYCPECTRAALPA